MDGSEPRIPNLRVAFHRSLVLLDHIHLLHALLFFVHLSLKTDLLRLHILRSGSLVGSRWEEAAPIVVAIFVIGVVKGGSVLCTLCALGTSGDASGVCGIGGVAVLPLNWLDNTFIEVDDQILINVIFVW